ncbi:5-formyltetrahydrofolate cyclo-ligase [Xanthobacter pseudotagetidis]|uniref:5-formyltetrahydrofolate cyclo-ligase n=1 Tax=Xanthobacter pseudotagetidis TaxID=3119911 RepID=UPI00372B8A6E
MAPSLSAPADFAAEKRRLRADALARRAAMGEEGRRLASAAAAVHARAAIGAGPRAGRTIALFAPFRDEIDTFPLAAALRADGARLALPVILGRDQPLLFRLWQVEDPLLPQGAYGIPTPVGTAPEVTPDLVVVPLAAFDRLGGRIGYGAGFYDRTLARLRAAGAVTALGYAFACQEVPQVPAEAHDEPLDMMITERGALPRPRPFSRPCPGP